jgi:hypothetical protein
MKMRFDGRRAMLKRPDLFSRFAVPQTATQLSMMHLPDREQLLVFARAGEKRALLVRQMAYHHVAQGELAGEPFLITI